MSTGGIDLWRTGRGAARVATTTATMAAMGAPLGPIGVLAMGGLGFAAGLIGAADQDRIEQEAQEAQRRAEQAGMDAQAAAAEAARVREARIKELVPDAEQRLANFRAGRQDAFEGLGRAQAGAVDAINAQANPYEAMLAQMQARKSPFSPEAMAQAIEQQRTGVAMNYGQGEDALRARLATRQLGAGAEAAAYSALASQRAMQAAQAELGVRQQFGDQGRSWSEWQQNNLADLGRQQADWNNQRLTNAANMALGNAAGNLNYATQQEGNALAYRDGLYGQQENGYRQDAQWSQGQQGIQQGAANAGFDRAARNDAAMGQGLGNALGGLPTSVFGAQPGGQAPGVKTYEAPGVRSPRPSAVPTGGFHANYPQPPAPPQQQRRPGWNAGGF